MKDLSNLTGVCDSIWFFVWKFGDDNREGFMKRLRKLIDVWGFRGGPVIHLRPRNLGDAWSALYDSRPRVGIVVRSLMEPRSDACVL